MTLDNINKISEIVQLTKGNKLFKLYDRPLFAFKYHVIKETGRLSNR